MDLAVLARLLRSGAVAVGVGAAATLLILGGIVFALGRVVVDSVRVTTDVLSSVEDTVAVADSISSSVHEAVGAAASAVEATTGSTDELTLSVTQVAELAGEDIPRSLESIDQAMPGLIDAGAVIDRTLRALALLGVRYDPEIPFDQALARIDASLEGLPDRLRSQAETLRSIVPTLESLDGELASVAEDLRAVESELLTVERIVADYRASTTEATLIVRSAESALGVVRWMAIALAVVAALAWGWVVMLLWRAGTAAAVEAQRRLPSTTVDVAP